MNENSSDKSGCCMGPDKGLLIIRIGIGIAFLLHGWPKISGGPEFWGKVGLAMGNLGITFMPTFWGFMAALAEFGGGICLILGVFFRPAAAAMFFTMVMATLHHVMSGDGFNVYSHALEAGVVFLGLLLSGPGKYTVLRKHCSA